MHCAAWPFASRCLHVSALRRYLEGHKSCVTIVRHFFHETVYYYYYTAQTNCAHKRFRELQAPCALGGPSRGLADVHFHPLPKTAKSTYTSPTRTMPLFFWGHVSSATSRLTVKLFLFFSFLGRPRWTSAHSTGHAHALQLFALAPLFG